MRNIVIVALIFVAGVAGVSLANNNAGNQSNPPAAGTSFGSTNADDNRAMNPGVNANPTVNSNSY